MKKIFISVFLICSSVVFCWANEKADTAIIKSLLVKLTKTEGFRSYNDLTQLNKSADFIKSVFSNYSDSVVFQEFKAEGVVYKNVICSFGTENSNRIIIGAHYDVCGEQQGADDNASGIVGLMELARMLKGKKLKNRIDLVAYTLEEPPFFKTRYMGSYIHAKSLFDNKVNVLGMVSLEMIGYFKDSKKSQTYPLGILSLIYGNKGNFITLVKKFGAGKFARKFGKSFISTKQIKTKTFVGPKALPGIDFSDHLNYWTLGYSALMITDTAFYRNPNYHEETDTIETLDLYRMGKVIDGVFETVVGM